MTDWLEIRNANAKALPSEGLRTSPTPPESAEAGPIPLEALIGPSELQSLTGLPRGSIAHMIARNGMPAPCLVLQGIRLWDARAITAWQAQRNGTG